MKARQSSTLFTLRVGVASLLMGVLAACSQADTPANDAAMKPASAKPEIAIFAGGCFWCMEAPFDKLDGVISTTSGYTGGNKADPTYEQVSSGRTGHTEAVQVVYDPAKVGYQKLLDVFWQNIDPVSTDGQFCDHGNQYRSGIFYSNEEQKQLAEASKKKWEDSGKFSSPITAEITAASTYYPAEGYHQDYYKTNPVRYKFYRNNCGRDNRLEAVWGKQAG